MYTCWFTNWIDPDKPPVRMLLFFLMLAGLLMSAAIPHAFGHEGLLFAAAYAFIQVVRSVFMLCALRGHDPVNLPQLPADHGLALPFGGALDCRRVSRQAARRGARG